MSSGISNIAPKNIINLDFARQKRKIINESDTSELESDDQLSSPRGSKNLSVRELRESDESDSLKDDSVMSHVQTEEED